MTTPIPRINPRRPAVRSASGLRRIVLGSTAGGTLHAALTTTSHAPTRSPRSLGPFRQCLLVVAHASRGSLDEHARQTIALAALLATPDTEVVLAVLGACHDDPAELGADRLLVQSAGEAETHGLQAAVAWLQALHQQLAPLQTHLPDRGPDADLGRRWACAAGLRLAAGVLAVEPDPTRGEMRLRVRVHARQDRLLPGHGVAGAQVVLSAPGVARRELPFVGLGQAWSGAAPDWAEVDELGLTDLGVQPGDAAQVALEEADFILAAGHGMRDLPLFHELAQALGAATGASRVAVDEGRFPRARQIGATGKTVQASTYLALGISGAVQHLQGIKDCRHVLAVNTDPAAPIAKRASLLVVEDSTALMRELLDLVRTARASSQPSLRRSA